MVVARSTLRAITFVSARCASLRLTSIAPTLARRRAVAKSSHDVHILNRRRLQYLYFTFSQAQTGTWRSRGDRL
jgi:hypothetical protein